MTDVNIIFLTGLFVALGAALIGVFVILRRMALVSDALSHVALPGLALGIIYGFNPFWGALATLLFAVFLIFILEEKTKLATETIVGILFTSALALGTILTPKEELLESLFGSLEDITLFNFWLAVIGSGIAVVLTLVFFPYLARFSLSRDLARAEGLSARKLDMLFLILFAFLVAIGIRIVGSLLMGALMILPAATAKNFTRSIKSLAYWATMIAILSVAVGIWLAMGFSLPPGPAIILTNVAFFLVSIFLIFFRRR